MATNYNNPQPLTLMGERTPRTQIYKSESHKLNQAFPVKEDAVITQGMPVKLETDGTISPYTGEGIYLGIAHTDSITPAYAPQRNFPLEVTVMVEAFAIVHGAVKAAIEDCGYVKPTAETVTGGSVVYETSADETKFIAITPANPGEVMQILVR